MFAETKSLQKRVIRLQTARQLAKVHHVSEMAIHLWREKGLPCVVIPGTVRPAVRFVPEDVRAWLAAQHAARVLNRVRGRPTRKRK